MSNTLATWIAPGRVGIEEAMEESALDGSKMPTHDELYDAWNLLASVNEFFVEKILYAVIATAETARTAKEAPHHDDLAFTYEQVGQLLKWVDDMRETTGDILETVAKVAVLVYAGGFSKSGVTYADGSPFATHGLPKQGFEGYVARGIGRLGMNVDV